MKDIKKMYQEEKQKEFEKRKGNGYLVLDKVHNKVYEEEGNFFLCGFLSLGWKAIGKNRELRKVFEAQGLEVRKYYYGGLCTHFGYENGLYELGEKAVDVIIKYLETLGYKAYNLSRLD